MSSSETSLCMRIPSAESSIGDAVRTGGPAGRCPASDRAVALGRQCVWGETAYGIAKALGLDRHTAAKYMQT